MISYLRGFALDAVRPLLGLEECQELSSLKAFVAYLRSNFGNPDEKGTVRRKFKNLKQTGKAAEYFAKVREYLAVLQWRPDDSVVDRVVQGLNYDLREQMVRSGREFDTLDQVVAYVIPLDNNLRALEQEKREEEKIKEKEREKAANQRSKYGFGSSQSISNSFAQGNGAVPASSSTSTNLAVPPVAQAPQGTTQWAGKGSPRGPISDEEKERRWRTGACARCGRDGHFKENCHLQQFSPNYPTQGNRPQAKE